MGFHISHLEHGSSGDPAVPVRGHDGKITYVPASQADQFYEMQGEMNAAATDGGKVPSGMPGARRGLLRRLFRGKK